MQREFKLVRDYPCVGGVCVGITTGVELVKALPLMQRAVLGGLLVGGEALQRVG